MQQPYATITKLCLALDRQNWKENVLEMENLGLLSWGLKRRIVTRGGIVRIVPKKGKERSGR